MAFDSKPSRRFMRSEPLKLGFTTVAGGFLVLLVLIAMFEPYMNPLSIVRLKIVLPFTTPKFKGKEEVPQDASQGTATDNGSSKDQTVFDAPHLDIPKPACDPDSVGCGGGTNSAKEIVIPDHPIGVDDPPLSLENAIPLELGYETRKPTCNVTDPRTDVCEMDGDIRIHGKSGVVDFYLTTLGSGGGSWRLRPYARKGDEDAMKHVREISVREVDESVLECQVKHSIPAVVFSTGGYLGNVYHDMSDVILPLYITTKAFSGQVQFLVTDYKNWWIDRYEAVVSALSSYDVIDLDTDDRVHCFPRATVGLTRPGEYVADPSLYPHGLSTTNFTAFLRSAFSLPRSVAASPSSSGNRPRLLLISRQRTRKLVNEDQIVAAAREVGFDVVVREGTDVGEFARIVNSCDVMVGVHGAGLTNMAFLPEGGVVVQIMPLGGLAEWAGRLCYGDPAAGMKLKHLQYKIEVEESTLLDLYPRNHTVLTDPSVYEKKGWKAFGEIYFNKQDVRVNVKRFRGVLKKALQLLPRHG